MAAIQTAINEQQHSATPLPPRSLATSTRNKAPDEPVRSFLIPDKARSQNSELDRFSFDYILKRRRPFIRFPRHRDPDSEPGLPPEEFWLINPDRDKFETPVDDRGLVDHDAMIEAVNATIDPAYHWPAQLSGDHFYWPGGWYTDPQAIRFRGLSIHKGIVPRQWENWKHKVTIPPRLPDPEVMHLRIESWTIASSLFRSITETERWRRRGERRELETRLDPGRLKPEFGGEDVIGKVVMREILSRHFATVDEKLKQLEKTPQEFRLVQPEDPHDVMADRM